MERMWRGHCVYAKLSRPLCPAPTKTPAAFDDRGSGGDMQKQPLPLNCWMVRSAAQRLQPTRPAAAVRALWGKSPVDNATKVEKEEMPLPVARASVSTTKRVKQVATTEVANVSPPAESSTPPVYAVVGGLLFWGLVVLRAIRAMRKGMGRSGSVEALVGRGVGLTTEREVDADKFYAGMMKNVNTVAIPELSDGEIAAARARRRQESKADNGIDGLLTQIEVPKNHPWATTKGLSADEEQKRQQKIENQRSRRRRTPSPDLDD